MKHLSLIWISFNEVSPSKALLPILEVLLGKEIVVKLVQFLNISTPIVNVDSPHSGRITDTKSVQSWKEASPILVTEFGIEIEVIPVPLNAYLLIVLNEHLSVPSYLIKLTSFKSSMPSKQLSVIFFKLGLILIFPNDVPTKSFVPEEVIEELLVFVIVNGKLITPSSHFPGISSPSSP